MNTWVAWARGPFLYLAFSVLAVGALRQWALAIGELARAHRMAGDQKVPWRWMFKKSLGWIVPVNALRGGGPASPSRSPRRSSTSACCWCRSFSPATWR